jgi:lipopolysaccharide exporter
MGASLRRGLAWSTVNILTLRFGNLLVGIVLARLLAPEEFGVFAVGLTVLTVLSGFADLSMSVDLVRAKNPEERAPTVASVSLISGILLALAMSLGSGQIASLLNAPDAANVLMVLSWSLVLTSFCVVPFAKLQRNFDQKKIFATSVVDLTLSTTVTIGAILLGMGPMALALGRLAGQGAATVLQFVLAGVRPQFGLDRAIARSALAFGLPLAAANVLSWALLSVGNVAIARIGGAAALGLYVLAFNISSWPMNAIGQAVRGVSLAGFSRTDESRHAQSLVTGSALTWAAGLPAGVLLAALAQPLVVLLYGEPWAHASTALAALGIFGAVRVLVDLVATYLIARGASRAVLYVQIVWFAALIPVVALCTQRWGIAGAGWAQVAIAALVVFPAYALAVKHVGASPLALLRALWWPAVAAVPTWLVAHAAAVEISEPLVALLVGGVAGSACYVALTFRWATRLLPESALPRRWRPAVRMDQPRLEGAA